MCALTVNNSLLFKDFDAPFPFDLSQDYTTPRIDLFAEVNGMGRVSTFTGEAVEFGSYGIPQSTGSIKVHNGVYVHLPL